MEVLEALRTRRSIRNFKAKPVEEEKINKIIDAARLAPSGRNAQPVEYIIVRDKEKREKLADLASYGNFIAQAPVCIVVCSKKIEHDLEDGSAATENILLAAHGLGLSSCWVAGYKKSYSEAVENYLGIPNNYRLISLLPIGYSDRNPEPPSKRSLDDVIHFEEF